jgi:hypothetical protein
MQSKSDKVDMTAVYSPKQNHLLTAFLGCVSYRAGLPAPEISVVGFDGMVDVT